MRVRATTFIDDFFLRILRLSLDSIKRCSSISAIKEVGLFMIGLKPLMEKHGDTMQELAKVFHVKTNTIWRWRAGRSLPSLDIQRRLCERSGCNFDQLLSGGEAYRQH